MSEPETKNSHTTIVVACVGAMAVVVAAVIGILPALLKGDAAPMPVPTPADTAAEETPISQPAPTPSPRVPKSADCVGKWRWWNGDTSITFDLQRGGSFTATDHPDAAGNFNAWGLVGDGKGHWEVENGRLTLTMTHVWAAAFWKEYKVVWFDGTRILSVSDSEIELEGTKPLRRE